MKLNLGIEFKENCIVSVLVQQDKIIAHNSVPSTHNRQSDILLMLQGLFAKIEDIDTTKIFTTVVFDAYRHVRRQKEELSKVVAIRLASKATHSVRPFCEFSSEMKNLIESESFIVNGGYEYDGTPLCHVNSKQIDHIVELTKNGCTNFSVTGVFSPYNDEQEQLVKALILSKQPLSNVVISSELGGLSLLERENAAILSCSLKTTIDKMIDDVKYGMTSMGISYNSLYVCLADGTMVHYLNAPRYAIKTYCVNHTFDLVANIRSNVGDVVWSKYLYEQLHLIDKTVEVDGVDVAMTLPSSLNIKTDRIIDKELSGAYGSCFATLSRTKSQMVTQIQSHDQDFIQAEKERLITAFVHGDISYHCAYCDVQITPVAHHPKGDCMLVIKVLG